MGLALAGSVFTHVLLLVAFLYPRAASESPSKEAARKVDPEPSAAREQPDESSPDAPAEFEVAAVLLEDAPDDVRDSEPLDSPEPELVDIEPEPEPEPEPELPPELPTPPPEPELVPEPSPTPAPPPPNLVAVDQLESNEERPLDAQFVAEQDNIALQQTVAEETVLFNESEQAESADSDSIDDVVAAAAASSQPQLAEQVTGRPSTDLEPSGAVEPSNSAPQQAAARQQDSQQQQRPQAPSADRPSAASAETRASDGGEAMAATRNDDLAGPQLPENGASSIPQTGASLSEFTLAAAAARAAQSAQAASDGEHGELLRQMQPNQASYEDMFGERDQAALAEVRREVAENSFVGDHQGQAERIRGTLQNFDANVATGTETHLTTMSAPFARYIHEMHNHIHPRWTEILIRWDLSYGPTSTVSDRSLFTEIEYVIGRDGSMEDVRVLRSAREPLFMQEAVAMAWSIGPLSPPPPGMLSSDGRTYIHWRFHRDNRQCGTFGASVHFLDSPETDEGK